MKLSDHIALCEALMKEHGDIQVLIEGSDNVIKEIYPKLAKIVSGVSKLSMSEAELQTVRSNIVKSKDTDWGASYERRLQEDRNMRQVWSKDAYIRIMEGLTKRNEEVLQEYLDAPYTVLF